MLSGLYSLKSIEQTDNANYTAQITVNAGHEVFKGHFPGNPVMPGVCMIQIIKEITQHIVNVPLMLQSVSSVKFSAIINPNLNPELRFEIEVQKTDDNFFIVKNTSYFDTTIALKMSGVFAAR